MPAARGPQFQGPLFHGTNSELDEVKPASVAKSGTPSSSHRNMAARFGGPYDPYTHAHASEKENPAWFFASRAADNGGGRSRVLTTEPAPDMKMGLEHRRNPEGGRDYPNHAEWVSPTGFKVTGSVDIQPPETVRKPGKHMRYHPNPEGRQGTLPLDWRPFHSHPYDTHANHPTGRLRQQEQERAAEQQRVREGKQTPSTTGRYGARVPGRELKHPPMYLGGVKVDDNVSEQFQALRAGGQKQPMLPGMRGAVKRTRKSA